MLETDHEDKLREAPVGFSMSAATHSEGGVCPQNFPSGLQGIFTVGMCAWIQ